MPDSKIALKIIDLPVLPTTSVNESNKPELNSLAEIEAAYGNNDYLIIDPATFQNFLRLLLIYLGSIKILRQGAIIRIKWKTANNKIGGL